jgi:hypothetical protein
MHRVYLVVLFIDLFKHWLPTLCKELHEKNAFTLVAFVFKRAVVYKVAEEKGQFMVTYLISRSESVRSWFL